MTIAMLLRNTLTAAQRRRSGVAAGQVATVRRVQSSASAPRFVGAFVCRRKYVEQGTVKWFSNEKG